MITLHKNKEGHYILYIYGVPCDHHYNYIDFHVKNGILYNKSDHYDARHLIQKANFWVV